MIKFVTKAITTSLAVIFAAYILSGVHIKDTLTAMIVAVVLGLLNTFVKPLLIALTIPITLVTLGLFLLVINVLIVKWTSEIVGDFRVDSWWSALLFSLIVSFVSSVIERLINKYAKDKKHREDTRFDGQEF
ncbi:MAG: phage holin family protein [Chitinophagaceae bacterium]